MDCVNLKQHFGKTYRVTYEESYYAQFGPNARIEDPWLMIVPCRYGHIFPHGGNLLAASVDGYPKVAGVLRRLPCCRIHQDGDFGELTVLFDVADFAKVARIIRPRRRRQVSTEQRKRLVDMGAKFRFRPGVEIDLAARGCVPATQVDLGSHRTAAGPLLAPRVHIEKEKGVVLIAVGHDAFEVA